jgi:hypothetical protein
MTQVKKKAQSIQRRRRKKKDLETCDERVYLMEVWMKGAEADEGSDQLFLPASGRDITEEDCQ